LFVGRGKATAIDNQLSSAEISAIVKEAYTYAFPRLTAYRFAHATFL